MDTNDIFANAKGTEGLAQSFVHKEQRLDRAGITLMALPPGHVSFEIKTNKTLLNVQPFGSRSAVDYQRVEGTDYQGAVLNGCAFDMFAKGISLDLQARNFDWEIVLEFDDGVLSKLDAEAYDGFWEMPDMAYGRRDASAAQISTLMIEHIRFGDRDPVYLETLALAMVRRCMTVGRAPQRLVSARGNGPRIERAIAHLEDNLASKPSVAELADIAAMSPSWFAKSFRQETGKAVHAFARDLRLERAKAQLIATNKPISEISRECGFSDQSHMTRSFQSAFGTSPAKIRNDR
ncbi:helix-turn-helix domain-containing protein [Marivita hallyeonensis]|uniref:Helix-turn-helix domain-containing protein n=1 Tax=Marivita hallyeonensis TaxID=996342 RepID=A0A1M5S5G6_9RHOB|nr:AraC family transcriptional regulator [Marivita hallyeonensis]SHH33719.1 Helix-turn-helix domain-containing protein [Marivita hallyeonensis]